MFKITRKEINWNGSKLVLETGKVARQAGGAVMVSYGETVVLCTVVADKKIKEGIDFLPLAVHYIEKTYAAGKIPGGYMKREAKPSDREALTARLIDRPLRPLFPAGYYHETQIVCTVMSADKVHYPDVVALIGSAAALAISGIPFDGPVAGARVGYKDGNYILNPKHGEELVGSDLDLVVAGTKDSVLMVESEANQLSEEIMLGAVEFGHKSIQPVIEMIKEFAEEAGKESWEVQKVDNAVVEAEVKSLVEKDLIAAYKILNKQERYIALTTIKERLIEKLVEKEYEELNIKIALKKLEQDIVRGNILKNNIRIDGRDTKTIRPIEAEVGFLPRTHGSALFTRGETQAIVATTLGTALDEQNVDSLEGDEKQHFLLHYNFPPYSVGEATMLRPPGRREIGHGKLAWRALKAVLPSREEFPYSYRIVSEITESNGSSSMATVCGSSLSMMDAGVPLKASVAGIAMGLILERNEHAILSDILGDEDHLGDMDFKVAGTKNGITALQMDIKVSGITLEIMKEALAQAKEGRMHILERMSSSLTEHRAELSKYAPVITSLQVAEDKVREVIGSGGKVIRGICDESGAKIDIENDGTVHVYAPDAESAEKAVALIKEIVSEPEVNTIYEGKIMRVVDFGAFVNFFGKIEGLVHVSEISKDRVEKVEDVLKEGEKVKVKLLEVDNRGRYKLSMRVVDQETGEDITGMLDNPPVVGQPSSKPSSKGRTNSRDRGSSNNSNGNGNDGNRPPKRPSNGNRNDKPENNDGPKSEKRKFF